MTDHEKLQIDEILSAIADQGADRTKLQALEKLLLDRPDLQGYYAARQTMQAVLRLEYSHASVPVFDFTQATSHGSHPAGPGSHPAGNSLASAVRTLIGRGRSARGGSRSVELNLLPQVCAATLAAVFLGGLLWSLRLPPSPTATASATAEGRVWSAAPVAGAEAPGLVMRDRGSLRLLEKLTRSPLITNVLLPRSGSETDAAMSLCSGNAWFERLQSNRERGYLVALPADCLMEVSIDTEAVSKNSLAVVEVTPAGLATGEVMVFDNTSAFNTNASDWQPSTKRSSGQIGSFSELNDSSLTKYFLFTGSFAMPDSTGEEHWQQSDFRIQFDQEDLMVIGWDDSGYSGLLEDAELYSPDRDFNDIRAVLKFSFPNRSGAGGLPRSQFLPSPIEPSAGDEVENSSRGYVLDLLPGEEAVISITSDARFQNGILILDNQSERVLWKHDGIPSGPGFVQPTDRGVYVIRNKTETVQRYEFRGRHKPYQAPPSAPWVESPFQVSDIGAGAVTVGFEDSPSSWQKVDWKDLRIFIKVFSP